MSQDYFREDHASKEPGRPGSSSGEHRARFQRPSYMTVGNGSTSEAADRLTAMLDNDSGYGSMVDGRSERWNPNLSEDSPGGSPARFIEGNHVQCKLNLNLSAH